MGKQHGSKAAYEESRVHVRAYRARIERRMSMSSDERRDEDIRERNADRIREDAMSLHTMLMAAAMASGKTAKLADGEAEQAVALIRKRFT